MKYLFFRRGSKFLLTISVMILCVQTSLAQAATTEKSQPNIIEQAFDDWIYRCVASSRSDLSASSKCELFQNVLVKQPKIAAGADTKVADVDVLVEVLNLGFSQVEDKVGKVKWALFALTPLNVNLAADFGLRIGKRKVILARYRNCTHQGCLVVIPIDGAALAALKAAAAGTGAFKLTNGQRVNILFSLIGFTKAFNALSRRDVPKVNASASQ